MWRDPEIAARILEWWCEGWETLAEELDEEIREESVVTIDVGTVTVVKLYDITGRRDEYGVELPDGSRHRVSFTKGMFDIPMEKPVLKVFVPDKDISIAEAIEKLAVLYGAGERPLVRRCS